MNSTVETTDMAPALRTLVLQLVGWVAARPRTYGETMEAWRTSCPRLSVWEDALAAGLIEVAPAMGEGLRQGRVQVTSRGAALLESEAAA